MSNTVDALLHILENTRAESIQQLQQTDPNRVIYAEGGWRVKDIIGHITDWEMEAVRALEAFHAGGQYTIPAYTGFEAYNQARAATRWNQPYELIFADWQATHEQLKSLVQQLNNADLSQVITLPWQDHGSLRLMIRFMAAHEHEHLQDIANAVNA